MIDYTIHYKERLEPKSLIGDGRRWDHLISAFDGSQRTKFVFRHTKAQKKTWLVLPEYAIQPSEVPDGALELSEDDDELTRINGALTTLGITSTTALCIDITGILVPYLFAIFRFLRNTGVSKVGVFYGDPERYRDKENTRFSDEEVLEVRQIAGYEGAHVPDTNHDLLIIGVGYDHKLVISVADHKEHARKSLLFGFPSLRPDMYQEGILRARHAAQAVGPEASDPESYEFAPANDPFVTASVISQIVRDYRLRERKDCNIYLAPLATKPQALGFVLYYLAEGEGGAISVIYPFCGRHNRLAAEGVSAVWLYSVELAST